MDETNETTGPIRRELTWQSMKASEESALVEWEALYATAEANGEDTFALQFAIDATRHNIRLMERKIAKEEKAQ